MNKSLQTLGLGVASMFIQGLAVCYMWLFLFVPMGARALRLRDAIAVSFFLHFFLSAYKLSNEPEKKLSYRFTVTTVNAFVFVILAMFYSLALL